MNPAMQRPNDPGQSGGRQGGGAVNMHGVEQELWKLRVEVQQYRDLLRRLQWEREYTVARKRRRLLTAGLVISLVCHLGLILYLHFRSSDAGHPGATQAAFDVAILDAEDLIPLGDADFDNVSAREPTDLSEVSLDEDMRVVDLVAIEADLRVLGGEQVDSLGGSGDSGSGDSGLGGGGGGTSYFGVSGRGTRFAYIVDRSGSMDDGNRMTIAIRELARSVQALPDYAYFHVVFFSTMVLEPPMQNGWIPAKRGNIAPFVRWLSDVTASGGTVPKPAFEAIFALDVRPDVIFFMTDGIITDFSAQEVRALNSRGKRVVIHTIAFGDAGSEELLRQIAKDSGGMYRYVPDGGP